MGVKLTFVKLLGIGAGFCRYGILFLFVLSCFVMPCFVRTKLYYIFSR